MCVCVYITLTHPLFLSIFVCTYTYTYTHNTYKHRYRYWPMKTLGTKHGIMKVLNKCYIEPAHGWISFMLSPVHWGPRISASFSSEFHPEKKRMKQTQPEKAVNLSHAQGLIHFTNSILGHCFPSLSLEAGHFPKENRMVFFCLEMPSARTLIRSVSISCVSSKVLVIMVQSYHLIIMNYWFH